MTDSRRYGPRSVVLVIAALLALCGLMVAYPASAATRYRHRPTTTTRATSTTTTVPVGRPVAGLSFGSAWENTYVTAMMSSQKADAWVQIKAAGVTWVRIDVSYTTGGGWWSQPLIADAVTNGMHVDALLTDFDAEFNNPGQVAAFATAAAEHYSPDGVHTYEVGNELNLGGHPGPANPAQYTADLQAAYRAIKHVDPASTVLVGGLAPAATDGADYSPADFTDAIYAAGAEGYFDAMNVHPYSYPDQPMQPDGWNAFYNLPAIHQAMVDHGDGAKTVWLSEYGAPTVGDPAGNGSVTEAAQAEMIAGAFAQVARWGWAGPLFVFNWQDSADGAFGMLRPDGTAKPALAALTDR